MENFPFLDSACEPINWIMSMFSLSFPISTLSKWIMRKECVFGHFEGMVNHQLKLPFFWKLDLCGDFVNKIVLGFVWYAASDESLSEIRFFPYNIMISIFVKVLPSLNKQSSLTKRDQCTLECESQKDLATLASIQSLVYIHLWVLLCSYDDFESTIFRSIW